MIRQVRAGGLRLPCSFKVNQPPPLCKPMLELLGTTCKLWRGLTMTTCFNGSSLKSLELTNQGCTLTFLMCRASNIGRNSHKVINPLLMFSPNSLVLYTSVGVPWCAMGCVTLTSSNASARDEVYAMRCGFYQYGKGGSGLPGMLRATVKTAWSGNGSAVTETAWIHSRISGLT